MRMKRNRDALLNQNNIAYNDDNTTTNKPTHSHVNPFAHNNHSAGSKQGMGQGD